MNEFRINGVVSRVELVQTKERETKILALTTKTTKPSKLQAEVESLNKQRAADKKFQFRFEPFAVDILPLQCKDIAVLCSRQAKAMTYCPGMATQTGFGCSVGASPESCLKYLQAIYDLAVKYNAEATRFAEGVMAAGGAAELPNPPNTLVLEYLRHIEYNSRKFQLLIYGVDPEWITSATKVMPVVDMINYVSDPVYPSVIKLSHFGYSANGLIYMGIPSPRSNNNRGDIAGWAGDLATFYNEWKLSNVKSGSAFCQERLARPDWETTFKLRDILEDVDAFNIGKALLQKDPPTIVEEMKRLFSSGYKTRFGRFYRDRFNADRETVITVASDLLKGVLIQGSPLHDGLISKKVPKPDSIPPSELRDFCGGFADVLIKLVNDE
jgi:hypothetical protein